MQQNEKTAYFTMAERLLYILSVCGILLAFGIFDRENDLSLAASLLGVTSLILNAKGHPVGQALMILFSLLYGIISYTFSYYGEMITYLGMTMPMAILALIAWIRNPFPGRHREVRIDRLRRGELPFLCLLTAFVTVLFYFVLRAFDTAHLFFSTLSVTTSFAAVYLTFRRNPYFALAYAANDVVLIVLWSLASAADFGYISVVVCFLAFLANDLYGFYNWQRMEKRQKASHTAR
ncbi:MAG: nicotinamide mononucleotide transporter [Ruminococcaceae bacterium]|nr:nicotinamide mononucleotide transporter [Oscillospiraceae bacterium]